MIVWFQRIESAVTRAAIAVAALLLAVSAALAIYQVWTRYVAGMPSTWSEVAIRSMMIWAVFLTAPYAFKTGAMIGVELIYRLVPRGMMIGIYLLVSVVCVVFLVVLAWQGYSMMLRVQNQNLAGLFISIAYVYAAIPVGAVLSIFSVISRAIDVWRDPEGHLLIVDPKASAT
ncbi:TRAP transporter small permease [Fodinicurvata sp. EGI_FJ10296]|uniref:TRAP transporter small permease n=1 Tax=Fodinicurvata sp. EGI_FJ10296 TaxID=3231908 RepID=UPI0034532873